MASAEEQVAVADELDCVINPSVVADLGSGVPGIVARVSVDRSDFVSSGDVLAELESGVERASLELADTRAKMDAEVLLRRVNAGFGRRQHERSKDLFQRKVISTNDIDARETEARLARLELQQAVDNKALAALEAVRAREVLKRRRITSPIDGVVMERFAAVGEYVEDQPVVRVAQIDPLHVEVFVPVDRLGEISAGMHAEVWSDAVKGSRWQAKVSRVDRVADVASGTYGVRLVLPNPDYKVPAGLRCRLAFTARSEASVADDNVSPSDNDATDLFVARDENVTDSTPAVPSPELEANICTSLGPFEQRTQADGVASDMRLQGLQVAVDEIRSVENAGVRVLSEYFKDKSSVTDFVRRLRHHGVEDYHLIQRENRPTRVALGFFKGERLAQRRVEQLGELGFKVKTEAWKRSRISFMVSITGQSNTAVEALLADIPASMKAGEATVCERIAER